MIRVLATAALSAMLALVACAQTPMDETTMAATPTADTLAASAVLDEQPRPDAPCGPAQVTLYFTEALASDEPVVTPLLNDFMDRIRRCEATGNQLRAITIQTVADPGQSPSEARAQLRRRIDRVRAALVNVGAPADKIVEGAAERAAPVMGRRAEITADFN